MKKQILIFVVTCFSLAGWAQTMEVGISGGGSYYIGDLNPSYHFMATKPAYGVVARYNHGTRWAFGLTGLRGKVSGSDYQSGTDTVRGLSFESVITDISLVVQFNFMPYFTGSKRDDITPYIFGGIGYQSFDPKRDGTSLKAAGTEGQNVGFEGRTPYNTWALSFPFGLGVKYSLSSRFGLTLEWGMRKLFTDYLDDVSNSYYIDNNTWSSSNPDDVLSDPTGEHSSYDGRGNPSTNDWVGIINLSLTYKFRVSGNQKCLDQDR